MNRIARRAAIAAFACLASASFGQNVPVDKYRLPNGMTIILHEDHTLPLATVNIWYSVGSKDEPPHHSGFAHLFEHLMFMGTNRVPTGQFDKIMEGGGGDNNASTAEDRTNFFDQGPSNLLPTLLWLEADRLEDLGLAMTQKKLNLQRDVVKNERRQNTENTPYGTAYEMINGLMFPPVHPYHTSVIGSMSDLDNASVKDVQAFFARYYVPNNASMVVAGDFDGAKTKALIAKLFGTLPRKSKVPRKPVPPLGSLGIKRLTLTDKVEQAKIIMTWHSAPAFQPGDAEIQLAASVLGDGTNSRLYRRLVVKDKLATDVSVNQEQRLLGSVLYVDVTASAGADLKKVQAAIDDELTKFRKEGPSAVELERQSAKIESGTLTGLQSIQTVADSLNSYQFYLGNPNSFKTVLDRFRNATPGSVRSEAVKTLNLNNRVILTVLPKPETPTGTKGAAERFALRSGAQLKTVSPRDQRPSLGKIKDFTVPSPEVFALKNGIPVYYWRRSTLPLMTVDVELKSGAGIDPIEKLGVSQLTAEMITQGAGKRDYQEFQNTLDLLGADIAAGVSRRRISVRLNTLARNFDAASALLADAVIRPKLGASDFERIKRLDISGLLQAQDDVATVASIVANREFFGLSSDLGRPVAGSPSTVAKIDLNDIAQFHSAEYQPKLAAFYVAGSLSESDMKSVLNRHFGSWTSSTSPAPLHELENKPAANDSFRVLIVDKPGAVQTAIRFLSSAPAYPSPNRLGLSEMGTLLGGSFTSRLNQNLREDKGYTYGAFAGFTFSQDQGSFAAEASVRADVTGASIQEFLNEFDRFSKQDITEAEVHKADATLRTETINQLSTLDGLTGEAASLAVFGRPISGLAQDEKGLDRLTARDLNGLASTAVPYKKGVLVLVGDKNLILKQIAKLNLPAPEVVTTY